MKRDPTFQLDIYACTAQILAFQIQAQLMIGSSLNYINNFYNYFFKEQVV